MKKLNLKIWKIASGEIFDRNFINDTLSEINANKALGGNFFAQNFLNNYLDRGDGNSAEGRGLIEEDRIVRPENLDQVATSFAASGNAKSDPNVVGEFPRDDVAV